VRDNRVSAYNVCLHHGTRVLPTSLTTMPTIFGGMKMIINFHVAGNRIVLAGGHRVDSCN